MSGLENKIIISTRPLSVDDTIKRNLMDKGAIVLDFPMIQICPVELNTEISGVLLQIKSYQWIVFTSKNGVDCFFKLLFQSGIQSDILAKVKIAVFGKKTSDEVVKNNCHPYVQSTGGTSADLLKVLLQKVEPTERILLVLGELADNTLEQGLLKVASPTRLNVYKTLHPGVHSKEIIERIRKNEYHMILFTSPSGFEQFKRIMPEKIVQNDFRSACIGRTTEKAMVGSNCRPLIVSHRSEGETFVNELEHFFHH